LLLLLLLLLLMPLLLLLLLALLLPPLLPLLPLLLLLLLLPYVAPVVVRVGVAGWVVGVVGERLRDMERGMMAAFDWVGEAPAPAPTPTPCPCPCPCRDGDEESLTVALVVGVTTAGRVLAWLTNAAFEGAVVVGRHQEELKNERKEVRTRRDMSCMI
jgi:hypothetical protein